MDPPRRGVVAAAAGGMGRVTVRGGVGPGGPLRRGRAGRGDTVPGTGGVAGTGGWPLVVCGVCGWSARWLPSHSLVLFVHGGLWPGGVGWWAVVVAGSVLVVVVVGPLVVVASVVVGLVLRVWPLDPFTYDFSSFSPPKFKVMHFQNKDIKLHTVVLLFLCFLKILTKLCCRWSWTHRSTVSNCRVREFQIPDRRAQ